jgi:UDP-N-acetylglucosamine 4,6-dehydratase/5-epimerase
MLIGKKILILGGSGSLGNTLTDRYIKDNQIYIYSRGENAQWEMRNKYKHSIQKNDNLHFFVGDIRDKERLETCLFTAKPHIIIIASALKHIDVCENNINECINTNIDGIRNIVNIVSTYSLLNSLSYLECVVFVSTDKACSPVNVYGMCKSISERIIIEKTSLLKSPKFVNVRYGNVISSRGSLIPLFTNIGKDPAKTCFPITDKEMTRYLMTLEESVDLIEYAIVNGQSGDTIVPKNIKSFRILDIAEAFSVKYSKPIITTGIRPGEKIHEMLICFTESLRTIEKDGYYIIKPTYTQVQDPIIFKNGFDSSQCVSRYDLNLE